MRKQFQVLAAVAAVAVLVVSSALAQKPQTQVVKGKIAAVEGSTIVIDQAKGAGQAKVKLKDKAVIMTVGKATLAEVKPGAYIGVGAMPQADGSQKAIRVMIFPEMQRGTGEGHYPWTTPGSVPNSTMTNATVDTTVAERRWPGADRETQGRRAQDHRRQGCADRVECSGRRGRSEGRRCDHRAGGRGDGRRRP